MKPAENFMDIAFFVATNQKNLGIPFEEVAKITSQLPSPEVLTKAMARIYAYPFVLSGKDPEEPIKIDEDFVQFSLDIFDAIMETVKKTGLPIPKEIAVDFWTMAAFLCNDPN